MDDSMTNAAYDFQRFLLRMATLSIGEILHEAEKECAAVEGTLARVKGAVRRRQQGGTAYCSQIKELMFFLTNGRRPGSVSPADFQAYRVVVESLIARGELSVQTISLFV